MGGGEVSRGAREGASYEEGGDCDAGADGDC